jgi:hypothetical protein
MQHLRTHGGLAPALSWAFLTPCAAALLTVLAATDVAAGGPRSDAKPQSLLYATSGAGWSATSDWSTYLSVTKSLGEVSLSARVASNSHVPLDDGGHDTWDVGLLVERRLVWLSPDISVGGGVAYVGQGHEHGWGVPVEDLEPASSALGLAAELKVLLPASDHVGMICCYFGDWSRLRSAQGVIVALAVGKLR